MTPPVSLDTAPRADPAPDITDEFELDMRIIESTTPLVTMMCSTDDQCGSTCQNSACATSSNDPY